MKSSKIALAADVLPPSWGAIAGFSMTVSKMLGADPKVFVSCAKTSI